MEYNTQQRRLPMPEYGRSVQNMVDHALTIEDREERQCCANTIIKIMGNMYPLLRDIPDFKHKLWDHLAIMADFKLDIDYPYEVIKSDILANRPEHLSYPSGHIRYRHYGAIIEEMIQKAISYPDGEEKDELLRLIIIQMRKDFTTWNKDTIDPEKIADDILEYSDGKIDVKKMGLLDMEEEFVPQRKSGILVQQRRRPMPSKADKEK